MGYDKETMTGHGFRAMMQQWSDYWDTFIGIRCAPAPK